MSCGHDLLKICDPCCVCSREEIKKIKAQLETHIKIDQHACCKQRDILAYQISCATDLANSWAREFGIAEVKNPYDNLSLRNLISRLWDVAANLKLKNIELQESKRPEGKI